MNRLQLATLLSWAGETGIQGRKRLQKIVFFLQEAGCPLDCRYTLHNFGPYSRDVADRCDEMVAAGLIDERVGVQNGVTQYSYSLKLATEAFLTNTQDRDLEPFEGLGKRLIPENLWFLELGSTILLFYGQCADWEKALIKACAYKKVDPNDGNREALALAQQVKAQACSEFAGDRN